jgi:peptidoglycan/xylan/chitin deacetylase (PgdA/CDA1 family)
MPHAPDPATNADAPGRSPPPPPPSLRPLGLALVIGGHGAALLLVLADAPIALSLAVLLGAGAVLVWGTLWPHSRLFGPVLRRLPVRAPQVWLTFDDGPSDDTADLLAVLDRHGARATFFLVGQRAEARPDLVRAILAGGHGIGNHSDSHPAGGFWALPPARMAAQIGRAQTRLAALTGVAPRWFRAVAGHANPALAPVLARLGLVRVSWTGRGLESVDGNDARVLARLQRAIAPGAILTLHEGLAPGRSGRLLAGLLQALDRAGYRAVLPEDGLATTSQLLNGVRPHSGANTESRPSPASSAARPSRLG